MSNKKGYQKCIMYSTMIARGKTLSPNDNIQNNSQENYARYYITFIQLQIIESISTYQTFLYGFRHKDFIRTRLSTRVSNSVHPVMYARQFCTNKPGHKIYRCISAPSTQHHTLLHNLTILRTETFFTPACNLHKIYCCMSAHTKKHHTLLHNTTILHTKTFFAPACHPRQKISSTSR